MKTDNGRRKALKKLGLAGGTIMLQPLQQWDEFGQRLHRPDHNLSNKLSKTITAITLGAGARGNIYGNYATQYPDQLQIVGVAEPIPIRNERYCKKHKIEAKNSFVTWEHVFEQDKFADAIIITTPDDLHYGPCMKALEMGYDVLLEKPISPSEEECRDILELSKKTGRIVAVCHVLRYAPYFQSLRQLVQNGSIGQLVSVQHFEPIQHIHMSHSYVRGNWHNSQKTTPIILAKSCHDLDILRWIVGKPAKKVTAFGALSWFKKSNQPKGATARCMDGCAVEKNCPYSAKRIYLDRRTWTYVFDLPDNPADHGAVIERYLQETNYGRCVYDMENDQPDHYVCNIEFEDQITASFSMEAFTSYHGRRTRIMGSHGDIVGDMSKYVHTNFNTGEKTEWAMETDGHGGGDWKLVADWLMAIDQQNPALLSSTIEASVESHIMGFQAEKSRLHQSVEQILMT